MSSRKYIYDVLYGAIYLPEYIWPVILLPEVQRLRELRLCNINSLCLTGGANINRYEHTLGTCYLALNNLESEHYQLSPHEKKLFVLASIFHDVYNAAFGHSLEYIEGVKPENIFYAAATGKKFESYRYKASSYTPIYFGRSEELYTCIKNLKLSDKDVETIGDFINGKGILGKLLSGSIDIDNIDNVYRLAYHIGLFNDKNIPLKLAKSIWIENDKLMIDEQNIFLLDNWIQTRENLYKFLLLNPEEFSAKYMLTEAFEFRKEQEYKKIDFAWYDVDYQLLDKLKQISPETSIIIPNLMCGQLYGCIAIYTTHVVEKYDKFINASERKIIEKKITSLIKPEVIEKLELTEKEEAVIRGIKGIAYLKDEKELKISHDLKESIFDLLIHNELSTHKEQMISMRTKAIEKFNKYKIKSPIIGIHPILDINKTNRKITVYTQNDKLELGKSSRDLHLAILLKNKEFTNTNFHEETSNLKWNNIENIKGTIKDFLCSYLNDNEIKEHELYSEVKYGK